MGLVRTTEAKGQLVGNIEDYVSITSKAARQTERARLENEFLTWADGCNLFLTFKFAQGELTSEDRARKAISHFWNKMDRVWYSKPQVAKGVRIPRVCVLHKGSSGQNLHIHALAYAEDIPVFCAVAEKVWLDADRFNHSLHIEAVRSHEKSCRYLLHEYNLSGSDMFMPEVTHKAASQQRLTAKRTMSQLRRVLRAHYA